MSDEIDVALDELLNAPMASRPDDGFPTRVLIRISEAEVQRAQTVSAFLAAAACVLFALVGGLALSHGGTSPSSVASAAGSLVVASLVLSYSVQKLVAG